MNFLRRSDSESRKVCDGQTDKYHKKRCTVAGQMTLYSTICVDFAEDYFDLGLT